MFTISRDCLVRDVHARARHLQTKHEKWTTRSFKRTVFILIDDVRMPRRVRVGGGEWWVDVSKVSTSIVEGSERNTWGHVTLVLSATHSGLRKRFYQCRTMFWVWNITNCIIDLSFLSLFLFLSGFCSFSLFHSHANTHIDAQIQTQHTAMIVQRDYYVGVVVEVFVNGNSCIKFHCLEHDLPVSLKHDLSR